MNAAQVADAIEEAYQGNGPQYNFYCAKYGPSGKKLCAREAREILSFEDGAKGIALFFGTSRGCFLINGNYSEPDIATTALGEEFRKRYEEATAKFIANLYGNDNVTGSSKKKASANARAATRAISASQAASQNSVDDADEREQCDGCLRLFRVERITSHKQSCQYRRPRPFAHGYELVAREPSPADSLFGMGNELLGGMEDWVALDIDVPIDGARLAREEVGSQLSILVTENPEAYEHFKLEHQHYIQQVLQGPQNASRQPARQPRAAASQTVYSAARARTSQSPVPTPPPMYAPANSAESPFSSGASQGESQGEIVVGDGSVSTDSPITSLTQLPSQEGEQIEQAAHAPIRSVGPFGEAQNLVGRPTGTHLLIKLLWIQI